jgi:hypothetical protein
MEKIAGCTVQTGRNWPACFVRAQPLGLVGHLSGDRRVHSTNGGAGGGLVGSGLPAVGSVEKWC